MLSYAPLPMTAPGVPLPVLGQPAIITDEARNAARYKSIAMLGTGVAALMAGADAYDRLTDKKRKTKTAGYVAAGFGALSAVLFGILLLE